MVRATVDFASHALTQQELSMNFGDGRCPRCNHLMEADSPSGLCPYCLLVTASPADGDLTGSLPVKSLGRFRAPHPDELNGKIDGIEINELLGVGGMGAVYRARQINLDRPVAVKIMAPELGKQPAFDERFRREARTLAKLSHPNIVMIYDFGQAGDYCYLVMELIEGVNLREAIVSAAVSPEEALQIVPAICDALQYAHNKGVVHRDIKPENVLIGNHGEVKIADFGLAKLLDHESVDFTLTATQQVLGTRNYMAPEQIEKPTSVDHRADIYSLGVVFYELLTGELPLGRFSLPSEKAAINGQLDDVVLRTLEKEPGRRYQNASEIKTALESLDRSIESPLEPINGQPSPPRPDPNRDQRAHLVEPTTLRFRKSRWGGAKKIQGLASLGENGLTFEFHYLIAGLNLNPEFKTIEIPYEQLNYCFTTHHPFHSTIEIHGNSFDSLGLMPGVDSGCLSLDVSHKDKDMLDTFQDRLESRIGNIDHQSNPRAGATRNTIPFSIGNFNHGLLEATGIAHIDENNLLIEFETKDVTGFFKHSVKRVAIPLQDIFEVKLTPGIISSSIQIQTSNMEKSSAVPDSSQGRFKLRVKKQHFDKAVDWVRQLCQTTPAKLQADLIDRKPDEILLRDSFDQRLRSPQRMLIAAVFMNLIVIAFFFFVVIFTDKPPRTSSWYLILNEFTLLVFGLTGPILSCIGCLVMRLITRRSKSIPLWVGTAIFLTVPLTPAVIATLPAALGHLLLLKDPDFRKAYEQGPIKQRL